MHLEEPLGPNIRRLELKDEDPRNAISISLPIKSEFGIGMQLVRDAGLCFPICELPPGEIERFLSFQNRRASSRVNEGGDERNDDHRLHSWNDILFIT